MALDPNTKPTTPGTVNGEVRNGWSWVAAANQWLDFSAINIGNTNVVDNLNNAGVGSLTIPGGLGGPGGRGLLPDYTVDLDEIRKGIEDNPDAFNINVNAGFGNGPEFKDLDVNALNNVLTDVQNDNVVNTIPPINYTFTLKFTTNPSSKKGVQFTDNGTPIQSGAKFKAQDFLTPRTISAIDNGKSNEVYRVATTIGSDNQYQVIFVNTSTGIQADRTLLGRPIATLNFTWPETPVEEPEPVNLDTTIYVDADAAVLNDLTYNLGGKTGTVRTSGSTTLTTRSKTLDFNSRPGPGGGVIKYLWTLFEKVSGKRVGSSNTATFSFDKLKPAISYRLVVSATKGATPPPPIEDPKPDNTPAYKYVPYTETETRTSGEGAPGYVKPVLTVSDNLFVQFNIGEGGDEYKDVFFGTTNTDFVNLQILNKKSINSYTNKVRLTSTDFSNGPGNYSVYLQPESRINGTGEYKEIFVQVSQKNILPGPDITKIDYPTIITGKDYVGYNVDFRIDWESINTNYIDIYVGKVSTTTRILKNAPAIGSQEFNIETILKQAGEQLLDTRDLIYFDLYFIPYNEEGDELTSGKVESVKIAFDKGNLRLRRPTVARDIADAIGRQFDKSALDQDNSKYLTHLMHFGDGDNKVIATWDIDYETFSEYEDVTQNVTNDQGESVPQIVRKKTREEKTLVFKMYEPLPRDIQPNQQIWVSKIQSIPLIEQITVINDALEDCIELSPNFGKGICGGDMGFQLYDELVASGSSTSTSLLSEFVSGSGLSLDSLQLQFVSTSREVEDSVFVDGESTWGWDNFVKYSSAEERINNFVYKIKSIEFYENKVTELQSGSFYTGSIAIQNEINRNNQSIQNVKSNFDAFEKFLYTSSSADGLTYPKENETGSLLHSTTEDVTTWYSSIISSANNYDFYNKDYLVNNLPQHVQSDEEGQEFIMFFNMIGHHFDVLWSYTKSLAANKNLEHKYNIGIRDSLVSQMLKSLGWDAKMGAQTQALWQYAFGTTEDGTSVTSMTGKERQSEVWRRLLNNLPYLLKHKGNKRAIKAALACYGVPSSLLTIMEFGGPANTDGGVSKFSFEDRTAALNISGSESVSIPWKEYTETSKYPQSVEIRVNSELRQDQTIISSSGWNLGVKYFLGNQATLETQFLSGSTIISESSEPFPFYNDEYTQIVIQHVGTGSFDVFAKESFSERIRNQVSMSISVPTSSWELDSELTIGGNNFVGSVDEFRLWTSALTESRIDNHTLMPDAIDGNHTSSSTEDLIFRLDFEYPKDRSSSGDVYIKNVSIGEGYGESFATSSNFISIEDYPYHYTTYERTVTANVPSSGFNVGNKFRFESQQALMPDEDIENGLTLSYKERSTKKSLDTAPIDSNKLGLFFSPMKEINMDILKSLGQFELDEYIGDPNDEYKDEYRDLRILRNYYFERYDINLYEYIQLVRYIDKSLFEVLESLVPARAIVSSGLLIEPHILERSKHQIKKPQAVDVGGKLSDGIIDLREAKQLSFQPVKELPGQLKPYDYKLGHEMNNYDGILAGHKPSFGGDYKNYIGNIGNTNPTFVPTLDLIDGTIRDTQLIQKILKQFEAFGNQTQINLEANGLTNGLAGIYAENGYALITKLDGNGKLIKERKRVWLVTEEYTLQELQPIDPLDPSGTQHLVSVTRTRQIIVFTEVGADVPSGDNILSATPVNSNGGVILGSSNMGRRYKDEVFKRPSRQTSSTTLDGGSPVETFCTNPNILKVADTARGAGEPILVVDGI